MSKLFDSARVTPLGKELGENLARLVQHGIDVLAVDGEPDVRCKTCAFRAGTIANGCIQTLADAVKCVMQGDRDFMCHQDTSLKTLCHGYVAWRLICNGTHTTVPWDYSPDEESP